MVRVQLYAKPSCPACEDAREALGRLRHELGFEWTEVDVTADDATRRLEGEVPVLFVQGRAVLWGEVDAADARKHIAAAMKAARAGATPSAAPAAPARRVSSRALRFAALAAAAVAVVVVAGVLTWRTVTAPERERARAEQVFGIDRTNVPAPPIELPTMSGGRFSLAQARGKVVFVNFWATWCPPCREEMPSMVRLGQELERAHPGKFEMVAVSVDEQWAPVGEFFRGPPPEAIEVTLDPDQLVTQAYYCAARGGCPESLKFPESYIVDPAGRLVAYVVGPRDWSNPAARKFLESLVVD
jgi:thiol-disulfide isomerase/thioredoxin/glutaredoxin